MSTPSTFWKIEVLEAQAPSAAARDELVPDALTRVYYLAAELTEDDAYKIAALLLCDRVIEQSTCMRCETTGSQQLSSVTCSDPSFLSEFICAVEVLPKPGVMDPVALSVQLAINNIGFEVEQVCTARRALFKTEISTELLQSYANTQMANPLIDRVYAGEALNQQSPNPFQAALKADQAVRTVELCNADDAELERLSRDGHLFLNLEEMREIQDHYRGLQRDPTDIELETFAQTWSEHCVHKTLKSNIDYQGVGFPVRVPLDPKALRKALEQAGDIEHHFENLLKSTIARATVDLDKPWCLSVFVDNAGVIAFDDDYGVAFKVETHNHPSALEPYGGAATGIGGCIRDVMGCGLGAKPIANTDIFCFAPPDTPAETVPKGLFPPLRSMMEVVRGVRDYGNRMGIPTVNGALAFDPRYLGNPLVFCGCVGLIPRNLVQKQPQPGDRIIVLGGRTGRDGIHGATFSSGAMTDTHVDEFAHAVQIGNAITEKKVLDVLMRARDHDSGCLYTAITDCGAGGFSSAIGEMGESLGAIVDLDKAPLKYPGLRYDEIWISEAQERMVLSVPSSNITILRELCAIEGVEIADLGEFTDSGKLILRYQSEVVGELDLDFLHNGIPMPTRAATWTLKDSGAGAEPTGSSHSTGLQDRLLETLADPNIASKEWVIRQYDHEVQAGSVIKPLMGPGQGPTDGAVIKPRLDRATGVVLSCGLCPELSDLDPYVMALAAIDEAVRNNLCVGGNLDQMAILDNFCWGGVKASEELGALVRAAQGCRDAALAYGIPFISGKDSLNNVFEMNPQEAQRLNLPQRISIPHTLLISAISVIDNVHRCRSSDLKSSGNRLWLISPAGDTLDDYVAVARAMNQALGDSFIIAAHDVSDGGVLTALAEMVIGSCYGVEVDMDMTVDEWLKRRFASFIVESNTASDLVLNQAHCQPIGTVVGKPSLKLSSGECWTQEQLSAAWRTPLVAEGAIA